MIRFEQVAWLHLLWFLLPLAILMFRQISRTRRLLSRHGNWQVLKTMIEGFSALRLVLKSSLQLLCLALAIVALAGPQLGTQLLEIQQEGVDVVLAVDVSQSMAAEDLAPNRMARARHSIRQLLRRLQGDRVSLVPFSGAAFVQNPLTADYNMVSMLVDLLKPGLIPRPGTDLAAPINAALDIFEESGDEGQHRVLIVLSDGEDFEGQWEDAAQRARRAGVRIFSVGMASPEGAPVPDQNQAGSWKKDKTGSIVLSRLNESLLARLATLGNGDYYRSSAAGAELVNIRDSIDQMDKKELGSVQYSGWQHRYQWFLAAALLCGVLSTVIAPRSRPGKPLTEMATDR